MNEIVILGAGMAANVSAAYFRKFLPDVKVTVVGKSDRGGLPVVGESLVEVSTHFMRDIGLSSYLIENHFPKYGLTYYYKTDLSNPGDRTYFVDESPTIPPFPSFQINRFTFDRDLQKINRENGVEWIEGKVTDVTFGKGEPHRVSVENASGETSTITARWVIDATGRSRFLARKLGLGTKPDHQRSVFWFRLVDFDPAILGRINAVKKENLAFDSYFCTHHFFGKGNWIWLIPMRTGEYRNMLSIGIVMRPDLFPGSIQTGEDFMEQVTREHDVIRELVESGTIIDTNVYRNYIYHTRQRYSPEGWFIIGDAADAVDPLYSIGLGLVSLQTRQVGAMIQGDIDGTLSEEFVKDMNEAFVGFQQNAADQVTDLYEVMHDAYQCHMRMHIGIATTFHLIIPLFIHGYLSDPVGAKIIAALGDPKAVSRELREFFDLIARTAGGERQTSLRKFLKVQSAFSLNYPYFEYLRDRDIPASGARLYFYLAGLRLRLLLRSGVRGLFQGKQYKALLVDLGRALGLRLFFGGRVLRNHPLVRWYMGAGRK
jgi:flavin-dependent dehydrogenase